MTLPEQKELVEDLLQEEEFTLIVLDEMRYDYFQKHNNISGELKKIRSAGSHTYVTLGRLFPDTYPEVTVYSQTPIINSLGVLPDEIIPKYNDDSYNFDKWIATDHFGKIVDVWDIDVEEVMRDMKFYWTEDVEHLNYQRLHPRAFVEHLKGEDFSGKTIIWFMHPHEPYLSEKDHIRDRYEESVKKTLPEVKKLITRIEGRIVVTSDHGQGFGTPEDYGADDYSGGDMMGHEPGIDHPDLRHVPWLEVEV